MKVGIFETEHFEGAYPVIKLFDMPSNELVIFTTPATYKRFADLFKDDVHKYQWVILDNKSSRFHFFRTLYTEAKRIQPDIFYLNTITGNHLFFALVIRLLRKPRFVLTIHDINCMFSSRWSFIPRRMAHHAGKKWLTKLVKEFNVVSDTMLPYLEEKTAGKKVLHAVPGAVFENNQVPVMIHEKIHFVVPGSIDQKRRNYAVVFDLLQLAEEKKIPLHITLLGGSNDAYGASIIEKAYTLKTHYITVTCYNTGTVPQDEFDRQLNNAHFIFIPSVIHTAICHSIPEIYGITKSSGNIFDVIKHAKPFIIPKDLQIPVALESSCFRYDTVAAIIDLAALLLKEKILYRDWEQKAIINSGEYTIEKLRAKHATFFGG